MTYECLIWLDLKRRFLLKPNPHLIDLRNFNKVKGMTKFWDLARTTLQHGLIPEVVPDLRTITIGGTISGLGLESSSFKYGM